MRIAERLLKFVMENSCKSTGSIPGLFNISLSGKSGSDDMRRTCIFFECMEITEED